MSDGPSWAEFGPARRRERQPDTDPDFDEICAVALTGSAGRRLIEALRERFIERPENVHAPEAMLRVRVTQQQFVRDLEAARDRGTDALNRRAKEAEKPT